MDARKERYCCAGNYGWNCNKSINRGYNWTNANRADTHTMVNSLGFSRFTLRSPPLSPSRSHSTKSAGVSRNMLANFTLLSEAISPKRQGKGRWWRRTHLHCCRTLVHAREEGHTQSQFSRLKSLESMALCLRFWFGHSFNRGKKFNPVTEISDESWNFFFFT